MHFRAILLILNLSETVNNEEKFEEKQSLGIVSFLTILSDAADSSLMPCDAFHTRLLGYYF